MDDSTTIKQGAYFVVGIGITVFLLGLVAFIFYEPGGHESGLPESKCRCK